MQDKLVKIKDIDKMARHIRKDIAKQQGVPIKELKFHITQNEMISLIRQYAKVNEDGEAMVNCVILDKIFKEAYNWIVGIEISKLASKGIFDVYWSDEKNSMVFAAITEKENDTNG
ncbi:hypothetical protein EBZ38_17440 [bacterium]|nr:hypothetical protein [bacterium]NDD86046.1 hypothetical protein [bacterium]